MAKRAREEPEEFPEEQAPTTGRMLKKEATRAAKEKWQTEWDQGEKGRMTHSIIREVDRKLRGWNYKAVCLLTGHGPFRGYLRRFNLTEQRVSVFVQQMRRTRPNTSLENAATQGGKRQERDGEEGRRPQEGRSLSK
jgi:hypothetical protein